ncbi:MAG: alpha/beta fold hydrolase [Planctomycetia bacterium]|nr:alpha/beta fold hydrolase [Planctomycetia bacterium]
MIFARRLRPTFPETSTVRRFASVILLLPIVGIASACNTSTPPAAPKGAAPAATPAPAQTPAATSVSGDKAQPATDPAPEKSTASTPAASDPATDSKADAAPAGPEAAAVEFVAALVAGNFDKAVADFDETMAKAMPAEKLKQAWSGIETQAGKFQKRRSTRVEKVTANNVTYDSTFVTCEFEKAAIDVKIVYSPAGKVSGLFFVPAKTAFVGKEELWLGELNAGGAKLRILFHIGKTADGKDAATFDSLDQGQKGLPVDSVTKKDGKIRLEAKALKVVYEGTLNEAGTEITGEWQQGGAKLPLNLKLVDSAPQARRPQLPKAPFPYDAIEVGYDNKAAGVHLAGTLTVPHGAGPYPAAILITGSGTQDRDETIFEHKPFLVLADYLSRRRIAVLRVDDRGIGGSTKSETEATTADLAVDVQSGIEFLKGRPEIDPQRIGLIGHSEGAIIGPLVASQGNDVAFVVMLAGTTVNGEQVLYEQGAALLKAMGASEKALATQRELQTRMFQIIKDTPDADAAAKKISESVAELMESLDAESRAGVGDAQANVAAQARRIVSPWFRYFLTYDPRPALEKVRCPLLALNGSKDAQVVPQQNLPVLRDVLAESKHPDYEIHELPDLNHLFQTCRTGAVSEYGQIEETFAPSALQLVGDWIAQRFVVSN